MPLTYQIMPEINLVYVRYWGVCALADTDRVFAEYAADPQFRPDQKHLIDLKGVVEYERTFSEMAKLQARKADTLMKSKRPTIMVYYAPTRLSQTIARNVLKSWDGLGAVVGRIARDEREALDMLGIGSESFADLPMNRA